MVHIKYLLIFFGSYNSRKMSVNLCVLSNEKKNAQSPLPATILQFQPPQALISVQTCTSDLQLQPAPQPKGYLFGNNVTMTCTGAGYPVPEVQFFRDGQPVGNWGKFFLVGIQYLNATLETLVVKVYDQTGVLSISPDRNLSTTFMPIA